MLVFHGEPGNEYKHTALVAGWGSMTQYQMLDNPQPCTSLPYSRDSEDSRFLPWVVDRDGPGYTRAFNDVAHPSGYRVEFVHIPDWIVLPLSVTPWDLPPYQ